MMRSTLLAGAAAAAALLAATGATAATTISFDFTPLALPAGASDSFAFDINNRGEVVGRAFVGARTKPVIWSGGSATVLDLLAGDSDGTARAINDRGQVVGNSSRVPTSTDPARSAAVLWSAGAISALTTAAPGVPSFAAAINDRGQVALNIEEVSARRTTAYLYGGGSLVALGELPGGLSASSATDINARGQVVGLSIGTDNTRAVLFELGGPRDLGTLPGAIFSAANAINDRGDIVGESGNFSEGSAFLYAGGVMRALGRAPGATYAAGLDINNRGMVVGYSAVAGASPPLLTLTGGFLSWRGATYDLAAATRNLGDWELRDARAINEAGWITGVAFNRSTRTFSAYLLRPTSPVPEPGTWAMMIVGFGLVGVAARRRGAGRLVTV